MFLCRPPAWRAGGKEIYEKKPGTNFAPGKVLPLCKAIFKILIKPTINRADCRLRRLSITQNLITPAASPFSVRKAGECEGAERSVPRRRPD